MHILDAIACYLKDNGGTLPATRKVLRLSWHVVTRSGLRGLVTAMRTTIQMRSAQADQVRRSRIMCSVLRNRKISILCTQHTLYVAHTLAFALEPEGFNVVILTTPPLQGFGDEIHIVICPQMFSRLPTAMVAFQMEQSISERWFTKKYLRTLSHALAIFDYSKANIAYLVAKGIPYRNIYYLPVGVIPNYPAFLHTQGIELAPSEEKKYEVLFYGDPHSDRRCDILSELSRHFRVEIVSEIFGAALYKKIRAAHVVVNLHYYDGALLETTRICECLSLGVRVVSECGVDQDDYLELSKSLRLVKAGDIKGLIDAITHELRQAPKSTAVSPSVTSPFYLLRFLTAFGLTDFDKQRRLPAPPNFTTGKICLSLPETPARRAAFLARKMDGFEIFDGLRHAQGWIGCAMSYKYLATQARRMGLKRLTVCEDDAVLDKAAEVLPVVEAYLDRLAGEWDIFVGLIADLHEDARITQVKTFRDLTFVHLDRMTSTVFNIYNHTAFDVLAAWDETDENADSNTIDRYLEQRCRLRVITTLPFIAAHDEQEVSTLWGIGNSEYVDMVLASQSTMAEKVRRYLAVHPLAPADNAT